MYGNFKLLPLLIVVAMLAFSVRLVDVATGSPSLEGIALAEAKKSEEKAPAKHSKEKQSKEEATEAEKPEEKPKPVAGTPPPIKITEKGDTAEPDEKWRDASDQDLEYKSVKDDIFKDMAARRKTLDKREKGLVTREALLRAAEQELDRKYQELSQLRGEIKGLLDQQSEEESSRITSLVKIYEGMKPKDAARIFDTLDIDILVTVLSKMSERKLSPILAAMNAERARTVTIMLAEQKKLPTLPGVN